MRITPASNGRFLSELTTGNSPIAPIVPFGKPVHDRLRLEIARGCTRGCRFCQAGMIYRPVRERSLDDLVEITRRLWPPPGIPISRCCL